MIPLAPPVLALNHDNVLFACDRLAEKTLKWSGIERNAFSNGSRMKWKIAGIPRGGVSAAYALAARCPDMFSISNLDEATALIDDLADSGKTREAWRKRSGSKLPIWTLFSKRAKEDEIEGWLFGAALPSETWAVFPWEGNEGSSADDIPRRLLQFIGEDPEREGLRETPARFVKAWREWSSGYKVNAAEILKTFEDGARGIDEMIVVRDIPVYSHCEHHLAPFFGVAHVGYIPHGKIVGLSKIPRLVDSFARRLQVQERLTVQIADAMTEHLKPKGVGVVIECRHLCMESRGICKSGTTTLTSAMQGVMLNKPEARAELMALARRR